MRTGWIQLATMTAAVAVVSVAMPHQATAQAPRQSGTVKATTGSGLTLTNATGQDYTVNVSDATKVLVVPPGSTDLKSATAGTAADVVVGDKALVTGTAGDSGTTLTAVRLIVMKAAAIAESHAAVDAAWSQGLGGIVKSVDVAASKVVLSSGMKTITVVTTPATIVRHYSGDSISFADAKTAQLSDVKPGDQLRVRGTKAMDGLTITADEMVAGTFHNFSGLLTAVDATAGTVTLKDLASKKVVTVSVTDKSDLRRLPPMAAQMIAARMKGGASAGAAGAGARPAGGAPAGSGAGGTQSGGPQSGARGGADLSQMLARLPKETLAGLKAGDAVMIVASSSTADSSKSSAVTLLAGVDAILTASPTGETTLSPWSVGGGAPSEGGGGEGGGR